MDKENKNEGGIDLSGSPKDSDGGVKFEEYRTPHSYYSRTPKIIQWVIKYSGGRVKDENQANYVLLGFVVMAIIVSLFLIFGIGGRSSEFEKPGIKTFKNAPLKMIPRGQ